MSLGSNLAPKLFPVARMWDKFHAGEMRHREA